MLLWKAAVANSSPKSGVYHALNVAFKILTYSEVSQFDLTLKVKVLMNIILTRLSSFYESQLFTTQFGFRSGIE